MNAAISGASNDARESSQSLGSRAPRAADDAALVQALLANATELLLVVDREGSIRFANRGLATDAAAGLRGRSLLELFETDRAQPVKDAFDSVIRSSQPESIVARIEVAPGCWRTHRCTFAPITRGGVVVAVAASGLDVQAQRAPDSTATTTSNRYKKLFDGMPVMMHAVDGGGRITHVNDFWLSRTGYGRDEVVGQRALDFFTPHSQMIVMRGQGEDGDTIEDVPLQLRHKTGAVLDVIASITMERAPDGSVKSIQARLIDITESNRAMVALRESEARFDRAVRGTSDGFWDWNLDTGAVWYAPRFKELLGYEPDGFADNFLSFQNSIHPDDRGPTLATMSQHLDADRPLDLEARLATQDGQFRWFRIRGLAYKGDDGSARRVSGSIQDITMQKHAEQALRDNRDFYELILDSSPDCLAYVDAHRRLKFVNRAAAVLFGLTKAKSSAKKIAEAIPVEVLAHLEPDIAAVLDGQVRGTRVYWPEGDQTLELSLDLIPHRAKDGRTVGFLWVARDMTRHSQLEAKLRQAQKMEAVGQLTGGIAHDFNNLLSVVLGNLQLLERQLANDGSAAPKLATAKRAAVRGADLTRRLLALSRQQVLAPQVVSLSELASDMEDLLRRTLGTAIEISLESGEDIWPIEADPSQVENSLLNLAINARDAMPDGGTLDIRIRNTTLDEGPGGEPAGEYVMLAVNDTGSGIPAEIIEKVFEPFFTTKEVGKGTGLGLSMVVGFVEQSGGRVDIYSEPGSGTCVKLFFPRSAKELENRASGIANASDELPRGDETLLVVEDDPDLRSTTEALLSDLGYRVVLAKDGIDALQRLEREPDIALLFTDVMMPGGLRGTQLAKRVRELRPNVKILYTTGFTATSILNREMIDQGSELLSKPYSARDAAVAIRELLSSKRVGE